MKIKYFFSCMDFFLFSCMIFFPFFLHEFFFHGIFYPCMDFFSCMDAHKLPSKNGWVMAVGTKQDTYLVRRGWSGWGGRRDYISKGKIRTNSVWQSRVGQNWWFFHDIFNVITVSMASHSDLLRHYFARFGCK